MPHDLCDEDLITVPVSVERLDIYTQFLVPGHSRPRSHRTAETTDLILQLVAAGQGISVLPDWLVSEEGARLPIRPVRLGPDGIAKSINLGVRKGDAETAFVAGFLSLAREVGVGG